MAKARLSWETALTALDRWHTSRDQDAGRATLSFVQIELFSSSTRARTWTVSDEREQSRPPSLVRTTGSP